MASRNLLPPIHPGEILAEEFMKPLELSANALARSIDVTPMRINEIANGKRGITADTALRLSRYFGTTPDFWMNLQQRFDLETARHQLGETLAHIHPHAA
ncbi:HigA family addiction module antitoxin [Dyella sp. Tek66A03]|uniref:HigA family addiction module antitoxin n=1 Tax=Dyella sp. Tek66A03 TaxID=3458298 RepID=UPI00403ED60D